MWNECWSRQGWEIIITNNINHFIWVSVDLAEHSCFTNILNWGDCKSNWIPSNKIKFLVFCERGNRRTGGKTSQSREKKKNKKLNPYMVLRTESNPGHFRGRGVLSPLYKLSVLQKKVVVNTNWWKKKKK